MNKEDNFMEAFVKLDPHFEHEKIYSFISENTYEEGITKLKNLLKDNENEFKEMT